MKFLLILFAFCLTMNLLPAQSWDQDFHSDPKLILEEVFRAAQEGDFSNLATFCPPDGSNDGDTQEFICEVLSGGKEVQAEFIQYFEKGYIKSDTRYSASTSIESETAQIDFWFNHPGGESRSNETMKFVKVEGNWYLSGF